VKSSWEKKASNSKAFLQTRKISREQVLELFEYQIEGAKHLLLTSSPVQGFANQESDIDYICISDKTYNKDRMAVQYFKERNHFEVICFSETEVNAALGFLKELSNSPFVDVIKKVDNWKKNCYISRKYIERIVNGVDLNFTCPYYDYIRELGYVWQASSFYIFRTCTACLILAERAGENRAKIAYGINALLYIMDAILSFHGHVFSNKKWYLRRYTKFIQSNEHSSEIDVLIREINTLYDELLMFNGEHDIFASRIYDIYIKVKDLFGYNFAEGTVLEKNSDLEDLPFHKNATIFVGKTQNAFLINGMDNHPHNGTLSEMMLLDKSQAASLLSRVRAGMLSFTIGE
jgi:hypothetical protein